jgi:hypothetical protein
MLINHASHALCNQPALGGPVYWVRNIAYNLPGGSTRLTGGAAGVLFYHNTILSETSGRQFSNSHWRNNLILGQNSSPVIFSVTTYTNYSSSDYNGFRPNEGEEISFIWNSPPLDALADFSGPGHTPELQTREYTTLAEYSQGVNQDRNSILVDYDIFINVPKLDAQDVENVQNLYNAGDFDFRLVPNANAVDAGDIIPNVNNDFNGRAPDLGALEIDQSIPHYGPRL